MVSSLDGYIAKKDNSVSWFDTADVYEPGITVSEQDAKDFVRNIDCYVMGAHTYELAVELSKSYGWAYGDVPTIVLSHRNLPVHAPNIQIYQGDLHTLVDERLKPVYSQVWLVGGASLARDFIRLKLADELRQSILPILLGDGVPFFAESGISSALHLKNVTAYKSGMVELHYEIRK